MVVATQYKYMGRYAWYALAVVCVACVGSCMRGMRGMRLCIILCRLIVTSIFLDIQFREMLTLSLHYKDLAPY